MQNHIDATNEECDEVAFGWNRSDHFNWILNKNRKIEQQEIK
jgi:hypothetical protein